MVYVSISALSCREGNSGNFKQISKLLRVSGKSQNFQNRQRTNAGASVPRSKQKFIPDPVL